MYPHQTRFVVPADAVHVVPDGVPARRAVLAANMETALNGVWDARIVPGQRVAIVGAGTVGCLVARLAAQIPVCDVELVDTNRARAAWRARSASASRRPARLGQRRRRRHADVAARTSWSTPAAPARAWPARRWPAGSTVVDLGWYGDQSVALPLGGAFHSRRLTIKSSQVGQVAGDQRARWTTARRFAKALALLADPALDVLLTGETAFETCRPPCRR